MDYVPPKVLHFTALDVGQAGEFTAMAVLERTRVPCAEYGSTVQTTYAVRHLERFPIGTPYTDVCARVRDAFASPPLKNTTLLVDITGVGWPITHLLNQTCDEVCINSVTITASHAATRDANGYQVPKKELVSNLQVLLQSRRLHVPRTLPDAPTLVRELASFSMKTVPLWTTELIMWRERPHDDLVLAVAIAAWMGERWVEPFVRGPLFLYPTAEPEPESIQGVLARIVAEMEYED